MVTLMCLNSIFLLFFLWVFFVWLVLLFTFFPWETKAQAEGKAFDCFCDYRGIKTVVRNVSVMNIVPF